MEVDNEADADSGLQQLPGGAANPSLEGIRQLRALEKTIFVDRAHVRVPWAAKYDAALLAALRGSCNGARFCALRRGPQGLRPYLWLSQPTAMTFQLLREYGNAAEFPHYLELAIDFFPTSYVTEADIDALLKRHCLEPWRGDKEIYQYPGSTRYSGARLKVRTAMYPDRLSKVTSSPCSHFEVGFARTQACRAAGLSVAALASGDKRFLYRVFAKRVRLVSIDLEKLGRQVTGRGKAGERYRRSSWIVPLNRKGLTYDRFRRAGSLYLRAHEFDIQKMADVLLREHGISTKTYAMAEPWGLIGESDLL